MMSRLGTRFFGLALAFGFLPCACSGSTSDVGQQAFPQQLADAYCDALAPCCTAASFPYTAATCKKNINAVGTQIINEGVAAKLTYNPAAAGQCLTDVKAALQTCGSLDNVNCVAIFTGKTPTGGACGKSIECQDSGFCDNGVCAKQPFSNLTHGSAGQACTGSCTADGNGTTCDSSGAAGDGVSGVTCFGEDGLYCDFTTRKCTAFAQLGESCGQGGCVTGAYCEAGQCVAAKPAGAPCSESSECASGRCTGDNQPLTCTSASAATADSCQGNP